MRALLFLTFLVLSPNRSFAATSKTESFVNTFQIDMKDGDRILRSQSSNMMTGLLLSKTSRTHIFAQQHIAQSLNSIKLRAQELSVNPNSIKILRSPSGTIFSFEDDSFVYFYSTQGGKLLIGKNGKEKFDSRRVHLKLQKSAKSVAGL